MTEELKPCPFCGSNELRTTKAPKISNDYKDFTMFETNVSCMNCWASGPPIAYVENVRKAWNERV